jgi:hypothetical protein
MAAWIVITLVVVWIFISAVILISLCVMSSRFNQTEPNEESYAIDSSSRDGWPVHEGQAVSLK